MSQISIVKAGALIRRKIREPWPIDLTLFPVELRPLASAFSFGGTQSSKSQRQQNEDLDA